MLKRILKQKRYFKNIYKEQKGITGLETAIILIAFVVVAAVFAYTVLSAGLFSTQKSQEAVYSGIKSTESTMSVKGDVVAMADAAGAAGHLTSLTFTLANVVGGEAIDMTIPGNNTTVFSYIDLTQKVQDLTWTKYSSALKMVMIFLIPVRNARSLSLCLQMRLESIIHSVLKLNRLQGQY